MFSFLRVIALCGLFFASWSVRAQCPSATDAESVARARQLFRQGVRAIEEGRYTRAVRLLRQSEALCEVPATSFNLALALQGIGDDVSAARVLRRLLEEELVPDQRAQVMALLDEVSAHMATLRIAVRPQVPFRVGEQSYGAGTVVQLPLNVGQQHLVISAAGFEPRHLDLEVRPGASLSESIELVPSRGIVELLAANNDTLLEIEGVAAAHGSRLRRELRPGVYRLRSRLGDRERRVTRELRAGEILEVDMSLEAPRRWPRRMAIVGAIVGVLAAGSLIVWRATSRPEPTTDPVWGRVDLQ